MNVRKKLFCIFIHIRLFSTKKAWKFILTGELIVAHQISGLVVLFSNIIHPDINSCHAKPAHTCVNVLYTRAHTRGEGIMINSKGYLSQ